MSNDGCINDKFMQMTSTIQQLAVNHFHQWSAWVFRRLVPPTTVLAFKWWSCCISELLYNLLVCVLSLLLLYFIQIQNVECFSFYFLSFF